MHGTVGRIEFEVLRVGDERVGKREENILKSKTTKRSVRVDERRNEYLSAETTLKTLEKREL